MKKLIKILTITSFISVSSMNAIACSKAITKQTSQNDVINQLIQFNGQTLNLNDFETVNYFDLGTKDNETILLNNLNLTLEEKAFISSISFDNNNFYIDTYKTIFFNVKKSLTSNTTDRISLTLRWTNSSEENYNEQRVDALTAQIAKQKALSLNDNTISTDGKIISLNSSIVKTAIFTNLSLDYNDLFYLESITNTTGNEINNGSTSTVTLTFKYLDIVNKVFKNKSVLLDITWNNVKPSDDFLKNEIVNQISYKNIIVAKGLNLNKTIDNNTKTNILNNAGLTELQMQYVTIKGNLNENNYVNLEYDINVNSKTAIVYKNTIWYREITEFKNNYITSITNYNNNIYFGTRKNGLWKYNDINNNFINLVNQSDLLEKNEITSLTNNSHKLYIGVQKMGIFTLDNNNGYKGTYYNSPDFPTTVFANDDKHFYTGSLNQGLFHLVSNDKLESYQQNNDNSTIYDITVEHDEVFAGLGNNGIQKGGIWDMSLKTPIQFKPSTSIPSTLNIYKMKIINNDWFAFTSKGIYVLKNKTSSFTKLVTGNNALDNAAIISDLFINNKLYLGTKANGLWSIDLSSLNSLNPTQITNDIIKTNIQVTSLAVSNNILWISFASFLNDKNISFYNGKDIPGLAFYSL